MKLRVLFVGLCVLLLVTGSASAAVVLDFGTGDAGSGGTITTSGGNASGAGVAIDTLTVLGDGAFDGTYDVDGTVNGSGESGVGSLDFNTATNTITITGSISCQAGSGAACTAAQIAAGSTIVASTTLLTGTGAFSNVVVSANAVTAAVTFNAPDQKDLTLLAALGLSNPNFQLMAFTLGANTSAGGSPYTATSTDVLNTGVPEPTSIVLLGSVLVGLAAFARQRARRA